VSERKIKERGKYKKEKRWEKKKNVTAI